MGTTSEEIQARQRDMSWEVIEPTVQNAMMEAYAACCAECGTGQFQRMRTLMKAAVNQQKESMFQEAASMVLLPSYLVAMSCLLHWGAVSGPHSHCICHWWGNECMLQLGTTEAMQ